MLDLNFCHFEIELRDLNRLLQIKWGDYPMCISKNDFNKQQEARVRRRLDIIEILKKEEARKKAEQERKLKEEQERKLKEEQEKQLKE